MKIQLIKGAFTENRKLIIEATCFDDGILIDQWDAQIKEHMNKLSFKDTSLEKGEQDGV